ncbi:MAG: hypothetical protein WDZ83_01550 [Rhizobiaceae bacterium]
MASGSIIIEGKDDLRAWLEDNPPGWAQVIAARAVLRVLPLVGGSDRTSRRQARQKGASTLEVLRGAFISWSASVYPARVTSTAAFDAVTAADNAADRFSAAADRISADPYNSWGASGFSITAAVAYAAARAVAAISDRASASSAVAAVTFAAAAVDRNAHSLPTDIWKSVTLDARKLGTLIDEYGEAKRAAYELAIAPLWLNFERHAGLTGYAKGPISSNVFQDSEVVAGRPPIWAQDAIEQMIKDPALVETGFAHLISWYRRLVPLGQKNPSSHFGEALDIRIATQRDDWWKRDAEVVNAEIAEWVETSTNKPPIRQFILDHLKERGAPTSLQQFVDAFEENGGKARRKSFIDELSRLTKARRIRRVRRGLYELAANDVQTVDPLPADVIPDQNRHAVLFSSPSDGPLRPLTDDGGATDTEQALLYAALRDSLRNLREQVPTQELGPAAKPVDGLLEQPDSWEDVQYKKILWLRGNALRNRLARHDAVAKDPEPHYDKLPPAVAEAFRLPVEAWNILVIGDSILSALDASRPGPGEVERLDRESQASQPVAETAVLDRSVTAEETQGVVNANKAVLESAGNDISGRQGRDWANETNKNLASRLILGAYATVRDLADPNSEEARIAVKEIKSGFYKAAGAGAAAGAAGVAAASYFHGWQFVEFVAANAPMFKHYVATVYSNIQLEQVIDYIKLIRDRVRAQSLS